MVLTDVASPPSTVPVTIPHRARNAGRRLSRPNGANHSSVSSGLPVPTGTHSGVPSHPHVSASE